VKFALVGYEAVQAVFVHHCPRAKTAIDNIFLRGVGGEGDSRGRLRG
jgi:hypothetical protein